MELSLLGKGDDRFSHSTTASTLSGAEFFNVAVGFATVNAFGNGGDDTASIFDSNGDDSLFATDERLVLNGEEDGVDVSQFLLGFDTVFANGFNGGTNNFNASDVDYDLFRNGIWI